MSLSISPSWARHSVSAELATLREKALEYDPDLVLFCVTRFTIAGLLYPPSSWQYTPMFIRVDLLGNGMIRVPLRQRQWRVAALLIRRNLMYTGLAYPGQARETLTT